MEVEIAEKLKDDNPLLIHDGYRYRVKTKTEDFTAWVYVLYKKKKEMPS